MEIERLDLQHQTLVEPLLKKLGLTLSEYSFATLYLFREIHEYEIVHENEEIFIRGKTRDGFRYLMPLSDLNLMPKLAAEVDFLYPIPEEWLNKFDSGIEVSFREADSDYIFEKEKMHKYPGRHLSKKRNLVHQFMELYVPESNEFTSDHAQDAYQILEVWHQETQLIYEQDDYTSAKEAIAHKDELKLEGRIYYVDHQPAGFVLSERLTEDMVLYHMVKADRRYKGIYQYMYQDFAQHLPDEVKWLNLEQDLGVPELRQAKHSYEPDYLLKKYRVQISF